MLVAEASLRNIGVDAYDKEKVIFTKNKAEAKLRLR